MKRVIVVVATNLLVLGFLITAVNFISVSYDQIHQYIKRLTNEDRRAALPNYEHIDWVRSHFREFGQLDSRYQAYVGWRRLPFSGETINIDQAGLRRTDPSGSAESRRTIAFFGGSTMWGTGVNDQNTIASLFSLRHPAFQAYNFGESGYAARQSLNALLNMYAEGSHPDIVIFYDGVNDVGQKCRREVGPLAHSREPFIRETVQIYGFPISFWSLLYPFKVLLKREFPGNSKDPSNYDCVGNPDEATAVARALLADWAAAKFVVEGYGGTFIAILQPVAYFGNPNLAHIANRLKDSFGEQFAVVYPIIGQMLADEFTVLSGNVVDLRYAFDGDEMIYVDFAHVSSNGNEIIARRIGEALAARGLDGGDAGAMVGGGQAVLR